MNRRVPENPLQRVLTRHHGAVRHALVARHALRAAATICVTLAAALALGVAFLPGPGAAWARLLLLLAAAGFAIVAAVAAFRREVPGFDACLEGVERRFPELRSWLRNAVDFGDTAPPDSSPVLARAVTEEAARRLGGTALADLTPRVSPRRPLLMLGAALLVAVALAVGLPSRTQRSWATLWDPAAAAPPVRLVVEPGSVKLTPGAALAVRARVWGTTRAPGLLRDGEAAMSATAEGSGPGGERLWRFDLTQLTREQDYRVRVASVTSPRYRIALAGDPAPVSFEVEYRAPAYARLPVQRGSATRGDLTALRGSVAKLTVTFDRDLKSLDGTLPSGTTRWQALTPRRWQGEIPLVRDGDYLLHAMAEGGQGTFRYRITPLADAPPLIAVRVPSSDVDLPNGQQVPVEVFAQDDLGLTRLQLQYRKDDSDTWSDVPLATFPARPREARVASGWDASSLALLPGQSATFRFEVLDDNTVSGPGRAVSPSFRLRFPSLADLYEKLDQQRGDAQTTFEKVADKARELQKSLDKLARQTPRTMPPSNQSFERSEEMKSSLQRQQELGQKIDEAAKQLEKSLQDASERRAFDEQLSRKMEELNELVKQVQSKEFREALQRMQQAMEKMDRRALENEVPGWRDENQKMIANLDRTIDLIKKLRQEEKLQGLAQRTEELKAMQDQLNQQFESPDKAQKDQAGKPEASPDEKNSAQQDQLAGETEQLAKDAKESAEQMDKPSDKQPLDEASEELSQEAAPSQRDAAQQSQQKQRQKASQSGQKASQSLDHVAKNLRKSVAQMQQQQNDLDLAAVRRAAQDLLSLQRATDKSLDPNTPAKERADTQTDLSEGTSRVADSLFALARQTPFISAKLADALGRAVTQLSTSGRELATGNRSRGDEAARNAGASLNEAVIELRDAEQSMCNNPGTGSPSQKSSGRQQKGQSGESMDKLSQQQGQLNQRSQSLSRKLSQQMRLQAGDREEMQRMAEEQQRIREQMGEIRRNEEERKQLLGRLDDTEREMKEVEEMLRDGTTDPSLEEKQTHILSRMLDATRSLNRRDFEPQRESRPGEDIARNSPSELPPELLKENDRLRLDLLKSEADRYPAQYRAFIEAYLKSLNGSPK